MAQFKFARVLFGPWLVQARLTLLFTPALYKSACRSGHLAAIAPEDGAPTGWSRELTYGEFLKQCTRIHFIL